jgi:lysophospholipase L1-like esterase
MSLVDHNPYERPWEEVEMPDGTLKPLRFNDHKPNFEGRWDGTWYSINSRGWRGPEFQPSFADHEVRILAVGDSCTFGKGVAEADCWPRELESQLNASDPERRFLVANLGVNGYSSLHYRRIIRASLDTRPDLVVIGYNVNDFPNITRRVDKVVHHNKRNLRARIPGSLRERLSTLALYRFLRATYYESRETGDRERMKRIAEQATDGFTPDSPRWQSELGVLRSIAEEVRGTGAELAIFLFPFENMVYMEDNADGTTESVRLLCAELDVPFLDMVARFRDHAYETDPPRDLFLRGDRYHPNPEGYEIVARTVMQAALENGWLQPTY